MERPILNKKLRHKNSLITVMFENDDDNDEYYIQ
jgi:hypothetical protein